MSDTSTSAAGLPLSATISVFQRTIITLTVMAATMMEVLDTSIVNVALPNMQGELGCTLDEISWVSTGYIISNVIILPLTGWLSDFFGRKRYLFYSVILFTLASLGCGVSGSLGLLVICRVLQGLGGAAFLSTAQATLMEIYPKHQQGFAQAIFGMGVVMAPTLGPTLGGYLVDNFSWPWIFNVNIPVGILAAILIWTSVPDSTTAGERRSPDVLGIFLLAVGLGCLQTILEKGERDDWFEAGYIRVLAGFAVAGIITFLWWELSPRNKNPAINLRVLRNRNLAAGSISAIALGFALYGATLVLPQYWQTVQNHTAQQTGMLLFPGGLATAAVMPLLGKLLQIVDARALIATGMLIHASAMFVLMHVMTLSTNDMTFFLPLILRGVGIGFQFVPLSVSSLGTLKPREVGQGAGLYNLFRQLGGSFGIAFLATMLSRRQKFHYARLTEHLSEVGTDTLARVDTLQQMFMSKGADATTAHNQALTILTGTLRGQAANMTYMDIFMFLGVLSIFSVLTVFLFAKATNKATAAAH
jgi:DHA2 family multidrug resistance protein